MGTYQETKDKYLKESVDTIKVYVAKGEKEPLKEFAKLKGKSLNAFIVEAIKEKMEREK